MAREREFDRQQLIDAFEKLGKVAVVNDTTLEIAVYGGAALMLASRFRFASEDVDIAKLADPWPDWLTSEVGKIGSEMGWSDHWLNDAIQFHLSGVAGPKDHVLFTTFPKGSYTGLRIYVPTAEYMLALKLKALRINDPKKGPKDVNDVKNLINVLAIKDVDQALNILRKFFPKSGAEPKDRDSSSSTSGRK